MAAEETWKHLHEDLLYDIAMRLPNLRDLFLCGAVCKPWHSALAPIVKSPPPLPLGFPVLIFSHQPKDKNDKKKKRKNDCGGGRGLFFSLLDGRTYELAAAEVMITGRSCLGLSGGWLLTWIPGSYANLVHPFTGLKIELPALSTCKGYIVDDDTLPPEDYFVSKAVVNGSPWVNGCINPNCVLVALVSWNSALWSCRLADLVVDGNGNKMDGKVKAAACWKEVDPTRNRYADIVCHKGNVYATSWIGKIYHIENYDEGKLVYEGVHNGWARSYLVSSISGDLLIVERSYGGECYCASCEDSNNENRYVTVGFVVRKLVVVVEEDGRVLHRYRRERVHNLREDEALFIGQCSSSSVSLEVLGGERGMLKPNCIYFTDDNFEFFPYLGGGHDLGVFNLEDATVTSFYTHTGEESLSHSCPPLWYV